MCEIYVKADPVSYEPRSRTVRIHGVITTIRLENEVWDTLKQMAEREHCSTTQLIVKFHDELLVHHREVLNFASFLRVSCLRFLRIKEPGAQIVFTDLSSNPPLHAANAVSVRH